MAVYKLFQHVIPFHKPSGHPPPHTKAYTNTPTYTSQSSFTHLCIPSCPDLPDSRHILWRPPCCGTSGRGAFWSGPWPLRTQCPRSKPCQCWTLRLVENNNSSIDNCVSQCPANFDCKRNRYLAFCNTVPGSRLSYLYCYNSNISRVLVENKINIAMFRML